MTYPQQTPAPAPPPGQAAPPPPPVPGQGPPPAPTDQTQQQDQGGQSATDAAVDSPDPMVWLNAAELDTRFDSVSRPTLQNGTMG